MTDKIMQEKRDAFYQNAVKLIPMHWRDMGPDEVWEAAWKSATQQYQIIGWVEPSNIPIAEGADTLYIVDEDGADGCTVAVYVRVEQKPLTP